MSDRLIVMFIGAALGGMASGCGGAIGPSVKGDVIDYDEYLKLLFDIEKLLKSPIPRETIIGFEPTQNLSTDAPKPLRA